MSLLDGRYEVIGQHALEGGVTLFQATAPDGAPLRIEWFEVAPDQEGDFEAYRRLLRRLKRAGVAAVHDVIARPGAHYVAWEVPPSQASPAAAGGGSLAGAQAPGLPSGLAEELAAAGYSLDAADLRRLPTRPPRVALYGLTFGAAASPRPATAPTTGAATPERPLRPPEPPLERGARWVGSLSPRALSWTLALVLAGGALVIAAAKFWSSRVDAVVTVPEVVGRDAQAAALTLRQLGLGVSGDPIVSDEPAGTVLAVEPVAGTNLRPGRSVLLRYALPAGGLGGLEVPSLLGMAYRGEVEQALERAGLRLGEVARVHAPSPAGTVIGQDVDPGSRIGAGDAVTVLVSMGPQPVLTFVPDLVGSTVDAAMAVAQVAGIPPERVFVDEVVSSGRARGTVVEQSLAPFVQVPRDEAVLRLVVAAGQAAAPDPAVGAPDLVGMPLAHAKEVAAGWDVQVVTLSNPGLPVGVVAQEPAPGGGAAANGATLVLSVNAHPVPLSTAGVRAVVRRPTLRQVPYAWTIQPGIRTQEGEVWASDLSGNREFVGRVTVRGGEVLRGTFTTVTAGPISFELLIGGVPYGEALLVP